MADPQNLPVVDITVSATTPDFVSGDPKGAYWTVLSAGRPSMVCASTGANVMRVLSSWLNLPSARPQLDAAMLAAMDERASGLDLPASSPLRQALGAAAQYLGRAGAAPSPTDAQRAQVTAFAVFLAWYWLDSNMNRQPFTPADIAVRADVIPLPIGSPPDDDGRGQARDNPTCYPLDADGQPIGGTVGATSRAAPGRAGAAEAQGMPGLVLLTFLLGGAAGARAAMRRR